MNLKDILKNSNYVTDEELQDNIKRLMNFVNFARSFFKRKNPLKALLVSLISSLKDMLTIRQKLKMAKYRVFKLYR